VGVPWESGAVQVVTVPGGAKVVASQVDQLAANLGGGQAVEVAQGRRANLVQGPVEPQAGALEDVVGLLPALQPAVTFEHASRQLGEAPAGPLKQLLAGRLVTPLEAEQALLQVGALFVGHGRGT